jgi:hypothetical protein
MWLRGRSKESTTWSMMALLCMRRGAKILMKFVLEGVCVAEYVVVVVVFAVFDGSDVCGVRMDDVDWYRILWQY